MSQPDPTPRDAEPEIVPCCDRCYLRSGESVAMTWDPEAEDWGCNRHVTPADLRANRCECGSAYLGLTTVRVLDVSSTVHTREGCGDSLEEWQATISSLREENERLRIGLRDAISGLENMARGEDDEHWYINPALAALNGEGT